MHTTLEHWVERYPWLAGLVVIGLAGAGYGAARGALLPLFAMAVAAAGAEERVRLDRDAVASVRPNAVHLRCLRQAP